MKDSDKEDSKPGMKEERKSEKERVPSEKRQKFGGGGT